MFNRSAYHNSRPGGVGVLEVVEMEEASEDQYFVPLRRTELHGEVIGPLAALTLVHTYGYSREECDKTLQVLYRFPLPGDAAVTGVRVRFGEVEITTQLKAREEAEAEYDEALEEGKQAALLTRESPNVFILRVAGIRPDEDVIIETNYVQLARPQSDQAGWLLRVPLTTAPRYVREDELESRHAHGQPLALLRDPGHRFALDLKLRDVDQVTSFTHQLDLTEDEDTQARRVQLRDGEMLPDRDFVLAWTPRQAQSGRERAALSVHLHEDGEHIYFLALVAPPATHDPVATAREIILLVDHSGSMSGAKWEASDWTVNSFLGTLMERDYFALGLFHTKTKWFKKRPVPAIENFLSAAASYLDANRDSGGTNLGVALEQALKLKRIKTSDDMGRHVLVVTDAQVSDAERLFRLADRETERKDSRRISVLCIDAAPNSFLANELAERGGGVAYFLTSSPEEEDITTALEDVLADWGEPVLVNLRLEIDRAGGEAAGRRIAHASGSTFVDLGDLPRGRALWVAGRVPADGKEKLTFRLATAREEIATQQIDLTSAKMPSEASAALKALFGARKLLALEHLIHARYSSLQLKDQLSRMGYDPDVVFEDQSVYAENKLKAAQEALNPLLIEESLRYNIACAETGFVAVREEEGEKVEATAIVANALPSGWSDAFLGLPAAASSGVTRSGVKGAPILGIAARIAAPEGLTARIAAPAEVAEARPREKSLSPSKVISGPVDIFSGVPTFAKGEAVLFDSTEEEKLPEGASLSRVSVSFDGPAPQSLDRDLKLLIYVGDLAMPRATVRLADLVRVGGRPLNLRRRAGQIVRVVLRDPNGAWASAAPQITVSLEI